MAFQIFSEKDLPREAWRALSGDSFLSSPLFAGFWKIRDGTPIFLTWEEQGELQAGTAGVIFGKRPLRRFKSMPEGLYGGIFGKDDVTATARQEFIATLEKFFRKEGIIRADLYDLPGTIETAYFNRRAAATHLIYLKDDAHKFPNRRMERYIRHARREGELEIAALDSEKYLDDFYRLVLDTDRRHGVKPRYTREFFEALLKISRQDNRVIWPMVLSDGVMVASHIYFVERTQIVDWRSYSDRADPRRPNYILYDYIVNLAVSRGIRQINLGDSPPGAPGLTAFKERWGGQKVICAYHTYLRGWGKLLYRGKRA